MSRAGIHMYMYKASKKYAVAIFPYTDMISSYDLNRSSDNDTMSSYWDTTEKDGRELLDCELCSALATWYAFPDIVYLTLLLTRVFPI